MTASHSSAVPSQASSRVVFLSGIALAAFGAIAFAGKAIIIKLAYRYHADATTLLALRMGFSLPIFAGVALWYALRNDMQMARLLPGDGWKIFALGVLGYYLASFLDFLGLHYISATLERLILYLNPTIVVAISFFAFKRRISRAQLLAIVVSYSGVVLVLVHDFQMTGGVGEISLSNIMLGSVLVFASAVSYALYLIGSGEVVRRIGSMRLTAYASCVACALCLAQFAFTHSPEVLSELAPQVYALSVLNALACTVLPVFAVMAAVARIGAPLASQIGMIGPVSTIAFAAIFLGENMGPWQIAGTVLVMLGVFIVSRLSSRLNPVPNAGARPAGLVKS